MNRRAAFALFAALCASAAFALGAPAPQPARAQPILKLPTPEPTPDPTKSLPPLPAFLGTFTAPPKDPLSYDDPGMHFRPPDGWQKLAAPPNAEASGGTSDDLTPVAVFARTVGRDDTRLIVIATKRFDGSLDGFESSTESEARQGQDSTFVGFHRKVSLVNGMPAYFLKITGGTDLATSSTRYEYLVVDGVRGIIASYASRLGDSQEEEAKTALASLSVVLYPRGRR
jgi:hypothetical protein